MKKYLNIKYLYLLLILLFAIPSLWHIINSGFLLSSDEYFNFFLKDQFAIHKYIGAFFYVTFFVGMFIIYVVFLKKRNIMFKNGKLLIVFILLASVAFAFVLPITSSDVFSYATTGEIQSSYAANPYYHKISEIKQNSNIIDNEILNSITIWDNQLVIYGPLWSLICAVITFFSFSKLSIAIILFKIMAIGVHILNCILIYKITKKKFWVIFYGLNPYILFESISNVHNDIYLVCFTLLGVYFLIKRKNLVGALFFLACATCIKYLTVLLVPLILIYYYRNKSIGKRILHCIKSGLLYTVFVIGLYLIYLRSFDMIFYVLIQQGKYRESVLASLFVLFKTLGILEFFKYASKTIIVICIILYVNLVIRLLFKKEIKFKKIMNNYNWVLLVFILLFITNLCVWYFAWLFATVMWQKSRNIRVIMFLPLIYEILISYYFVLGCEKAMKSYWFSLVAIGAVIVMGFVQKKKLFYKKNYIKGV